MTSADSSWQNIAAAFQDSADEYESWFADNPVFAIELAALTSIKTRLAAPRLEIGIGPGLFAGKLGVTYGIDPALAPLAKTKNWAIHACRAIGEQLPFGDQKFGTVFLLFTVCFLADPALVFRECRRVLINNGHLVVGMIPGNSSWGKMLADKGKKDHPLYRHARLRDPGQIEKALAASGFRLTETISTLCQPPASTLQREKPVRRYDKAAGFVVMVAARK